eukprot:5965539-Pleurochrysis_carterae.AAC.1
MFVKRLPAGMADQANPCASDCCSLSSVCTEVLTSSESIWLVIPPGMYTVVIGTYAPAARVHSHCGQNAANASASVTRTGLVDDANCSEACGLKKRPDGPEGLFDMFSQCSCVAQAVKTSCSAGVIWSCDGTMCCACASLVTVLARRPRGIGAAQRCACAYAAQP